MITRVLTRVRDKNRTDIVDQAVSDMRALRLRQGLSQERLGIRSGVAMQSISQIEQGLRNPTIRTLEKLVAALGYRVVVQIVAIEPKGKESD